MTAHQGGLFAEMCVVAGNTGLTSRTAESDFSFQAVHAAFSRAKVARLKDTQCLFPPIRQFAIVV